MMTIDEVITALEGSARSGIKDDAIAYLKEYRTVREDLLANLERNQKIEDEYHELKDWWAEEYVTNDPLTWEELERMIDKPVWIQEGDHGYWMIIDNISITPYGYCWLNSAEGCLEKEYMGISWQAYRREKE